MPPVVLDYAVQPEHLSPKLNFRSLLLEGKKFSIMDYEKEIKKIRLHDVNKFAKKIYDRLFIEGFAYGNEGLRTAYNRTFMDLIFRC